MPKVYGSLIDTETRCRHYFTKKILLLLNLNVVINTIHAISAIMSLKSTPLSVGLSLHLTKKQSYAVYANTN